jgi:hypothetical protein
MKRVILPLIAALAGAGTAAAQSGVAVQIHAFRFAGAPDAALAKLRERTAKCWSDDYDSRVHGMYREVAEMPASAASGATVRLEWHKVRNDRLAGLLKRSFDIVLSPPDRGGGTRVTVHAYIPRNDVGHDIEAWLAGREKCFAQRYPSP